MQKLLLGLVTLFASAMSCAQSSVTVFGVADVAVNSTKADGLAPLTRVVSGGNAVSRLGFKGREDLGGGLYVGFWLEAGIYMDTGAGQPSNVNNTPSGSVGGGGLTFNRQATVSVLNRYGELRMGREVVASSLNYVAFDPFGGVGIANSSAVMLGNGVFSSATSLRASNTISYLLPPDLGGWYGQVMGALGESPSSVVTSAQGGKHDGDYYGARVGFRNAKLNVALAGGRARYDLLPTSTAVAGNLDRINLGGSYDFGKLRLFGLASAERRVSGAGGQARDQSFSVGAILPYGLSDFKLQYAQVKQNAIAGHHDARQLGAGWVYNFSKRTAFYTTLTWLDNRNNSTLYVLNTTGGFSTPATTRPGGNITGLDVGIRHNF
ncbi:MAG: porin [Pseudomonadota bacterium]